VVDVGKYLYVFGGYEEPSERLGRDVYRLDFSTFTWQLLVSQYFRSGSALEPMSIRIFFLNKTWGMFACRINVIEPIF
jgi:hypothetical protein